jgi:cell cycle arrest protein BUB3
LFKSTDLETNTTSLLGTHNDGVKEIIYCRDSNTLLTGSWDSSVNQYDARNGDLVTSLKQPDKVYSMDSAGNL